MTTATRPHRTPRPEDVWAKGAVAFQLTTASICPVCFGVDEAQRPDCEAVMAAVYLGAALRATRGDRT